MQVFHGLVGLKTHSKLAMVVRRDDDGSAAATATSAPATTTPVTARFYTDLSLFTCDPQITERVVKVFNYLTAVAESATTANCWWPR